MRIACNKLAGWFAQNATIVTPSPFLSSVASAQFASAQQQQGLASWERPSIYGWEAWLVSCWKDARYSLADVPTLLSISQERALWHDIIEQEHPNLFDVAATVRLARNAASLIAEWNISTQGEAWNDHADALQFQRWYRTFRKTCAENKWVTRAELPRLVGGWIAAEKFQVGLTAFVGFENNQPAFDTLLGVMGASAVRLPFDHAKPTKKAASKGFDALPEEIDFAARRLRYLFEEKQDRVLALFIPELAKHHLLVERTLNSVFFPSTAARVTGAQTAAPESLFRLPEAGTLMDHPIVAAALLLLQLASPRVDHADAGAILRCAFVTGAQEEQNERALADVDLRRQRELDVSFRDMQRVSARACPKLKTCLQRLAKILPKTAEPRSYSEWSEVISEILAALGWPGDRELTPHEDRITERWKDQLSELASLGLVSGLVTFESALAQLRRLLSVRLERGEWISPIQVLDASLANGVEFDAAIAVGLSEDTWPPPTRISPLVPLRLQVSQNIKGERAKRTQLLFESSPDLLVTFTDRLTSLASAFVAKKSKDPVIWNGKLPHESFEAESLEQQRDGQAPVFQAQGEVRGGTSLIKAQSQCPFQAFAKYRLDAKRPEDASFGFDAMERGSFVHKSLEYVWTRLQSLQNLKALSEDALKTLVQESIADAVKTNEPGPLHQLSIATERERLQEVILEWLELEKGRAQDFTVETIEQAQKFEVPGLSLTVRLDRIDRLKDGSLILIDYKSGKQTRPKLAGERPAEPQLLVYAASVGATVDGVFFGQLKPREVKAVGYSRSKHFKGQTAEVKKDWDTYIEASRDNVYKLADEFVRGVAEVRPTGSPCGYCGMKPFCRVNEKGVAEEGEE